MIHDPGRSQHFQTLAEACLTQNIEYSGTILDFVSMTFHFLAKSIDDILSRCEVTTIKVIQRNAPKMTESEAK
jgi:hypothetical protein